MKIPPFPPLANTKLPPRPSLKSTFSTVHNSRWPSTCTAPMSIISSHCIMPCTCTFMQCLPLCPGTRVRGWGGGGGPGTCCVGRRRNWLNYRNVTGSWIRSPLPLLDYGVETGGGSSVDEWMAMVFVKSGESRVCDWACRAMRLGRCGW